MPGSPKKRQAERTRAERYQELRKAVRQLKAEGLVDHGFSPVDAIQRAIDDSIVRYMAEAMENDRKRELGRRVDDSRERALAKDMVYYASVAAQYRLDERRVELEQQRVQILSHLMKRALMRMGL